MTLMRVKNARADTNDLLSDQQRCHHAALQIQKPEVDMPENSKSAALASTPAGPDYLMAYRGGFKGGLIGGLIGSVITLIVCFVCHYVLGM
jgi:predicted lipid-binding transport protein (Tim44 family)